VIAPVPLDWRIRCSTKTHHPTNECVFEQSTVFFKSDNTLQQEVSDIESRVQGAAVPDCCRSQRRIVRSLIGNGGGGGGGGGLVRQTLHIPDARFLLNRSVPIKQLSAPNVHWFFSRDAVIILQIHVRARPPDQPHSGSAVLLHPPPSEFHTRLTSQLPRFGFIARGSVARLGGGGKAIFGALVDFSQQFESCSDC